MKMLGYRKLVVALAAFVACVVEPTACPSIAIIAVAFFGAHAAADWKGSKVAAP